MDICVPDLISPEINSVLDNGCYDGQMLRFHGTVPLVYARIRLSSLDNAHQAVLRDSGLWFYISDSFRQSGGIISGLCVFV